MTLSTALGWLIVAVMVFTGVVLVSGVGFVPTTETEGPATVIQQPGPEPNAPAH